MIRLLQYRDAEYFNKNENDYFLFQTIGNIFRVAKLIKYNHAHYFDYPGMQIKSITTPSIAFSDLKGTKVHYKEYPMIKGIIQSFGIVNTSYVYVYWTHTPMFDEQGKPLGMPCALPDNYYLELDM